jgi:hypothetical protein
MKKGDFLRTIIKKCLNIEDKTENTEKIPRKLTGKCNVCGDLNAIFIYGESQYFSILEPLYISGQTSRIPNPMELYWCYGCRADYELNSLLAHGAKPY